MTATSATPRETPRGSVAPAWASLHPSSPGWSVLQWVLSMTLDHVHIDATAPDPGGDELELAALRAGDERAFLALVNRHQRAMIRVARLYVSSAAHAEEVVQEAWLGVLKGLHLFEGRSSLKAWIFRILVNCAKSRGVREVRSVPMSALEAQDDGGAPTVAEDRFRGESELWAGHWARPPTAWADDQLASAQAVALVKEAIEALPPAQRTVISLRDVDGWESAEVCELLGLSEANQRVLLHRARAKVRAALEARLGGEELR